jgi:hypothetical protein
VRLPFHLSKPRKQSSLTREGALIEIPHDASECGLLQAPKEGRAKYYHDFKALERSGCDVVSYNVRPGENGHTATFPEDLIAPRIESSCPAGGWVLDPFCGTGRALAVAVKSGRNAIGFDLEKAYLS